MPESGIPCTSLYLEVLRWKLHAVFLLTGRLGHTRLMNTTLLPASV